MKRFLWVCLLFALFSCTRESMTESANENSARVVGSPDGAEAGTLVVRLTDEAAETVESTRAASSCSATRSGNAETDAILDQIAADRFERVFPYDAIFEEQHRAAGLHCWYRIYFDDAVSLAEAGRLLQEDSEVAVVEFTQAVECKPLVRPIPDELRHTAEPIAASRATAVMNDPMLKYQWNYINNGPYKVEDGSTFTQPVAGADINLEDAWSLCTGDPSIVVAVIDEPIQTTHPDLKTNIWTNTIDPLTKGLHGYNFCNNSATLDWTSFDDAGADKTQNRYTYADHGTHVAGTIAAVNNNNVGVCGIAGGKGTAGGVKVMSCQMMTYGENKNYDAASNALTYAADHGAVIAQNSWGYQTSSGGELSESAWDSKSYGSMRTAINYFINNAGSKNSRFPDSPISGGLVIFAAGNSGDSNADMKTWPSAYAPVIAVGAMSWGAKPAYYTNYGTWVDITAPGGDAYTGQTDGGQNYGGNACVLSTVLQDSAMTFLDGRTQDSWFGYEFQQGTSMACPQVSGVAALGLSYAAQLGKKYTPEQFKALLLSSVYGIESHFTGTVGSGLLASRYLGKMGGGCVDALKLLLAIKGTPALYVKTGSAAALDLSNYFGGSNSKITVKSAVLSSPARLGLSSGALSVSGFSVSVTPSQSGLSLLTITAQSGDTTFTREFAVVSRPDLATNGGWL